MSNAHAHPAGGGRILGRGRFRAVASRAVVIAAIGAVFAGGSALIPPVTAVVAAVLILVLALGWPMLLGGTPRVVNVTAIAVPGWVSVWAAGWLDDPFDVIVLALAAGVVVAFILELAAWGRRPHAVSEVGLMVSGQMTAAALAGWPLALTLPTGRQLVLAGGALLAVAALASLIDAGARIAVLIPPVVAGLAGGLLGGILPELPIVMVAATGAGIGAAVAAMFALTHGAAVLRLGGARIAACILPAAAAGMIVYSIGRLVPLIYS